MSPLYPSRDGVLHPHHLAETDLLGFLVSPSEAQVGPVHTEPPSLSFEPQSFVPSVQARPSDLLPEEKTSQAIFDDVVT